MILNSKPDLMQFYIPVDRCRRRLFDIVNSQKFDVFIIVCILLNIQTMGLFYEGSSLEYQNNLEQINYFFTVIFFLEAALKISSLSLKGYLLSGWNKFDLFVVLASAVDIMMSLFMGSSSSLKFLRVGPQLARVIRVLRVSRLLKLVKSFQGLQKVLNTMMISLPSLLNVGALFMLVLFIYSVLGCFAFKDVREGEAINDNYNFQNFHYSLILLFKVATREDWLFVMKDISKTPPRCTPGVDCGSGTRPPFLDHPPCAAEA